MWQSHRDWPRFGATWLDPLLRRVLPGWVPPPYPTGSHYRYNVPQAQAETCQFILTGDTGINSPEALLVSSAVSRQDWFPSDFMLLLGDIVYPAGSASDYPLGLVEPFQHYQQPILAVPGNHDWYDRLSAYEQFFMTGLPPHLALEHPHWRCPQLPNWFYFTDLSDQLRLICLDTGLSGKLKENRRSQLAWLDVLLADSHDKTVIVAMHHPLYSLSDRGHDDALRLLLEERFLRAGVKAVFAAHDHNYQHHVVEGIHHIVLGGGGATLQPLPERRTVRTVRSRPDAPPTVQRIQLEKPAGSRWDQEHSFLHARWAEGQLHCQVWSAHQLPPTDLSVMESFIIG
jgi:hypothetical protein